jgi:hypothetical protein
LVASLVLGLTAACAASEPRSTSSTSSTTTSSTHPTPSWDAGAGGAAAATPEDQCKAFVDAWCETIGLSCAGQQSKYGSNGYIECLYDLSPTVGGSAHCGTVGDLGDTYTTCMWYLQKSGESVPCPGYLDELGPSNLPKECWTVYSAIFGASPSDCVLKDPASVPHADTCACVGTTCCESANIYTASSNIGPYMECYAARCEGQDGCPSF